MRGMPKTIEKALGETPLQALQKHTKEPATYAGRLDPMATGKLLILKGEEVHNREQYLHLDKAYDIEVLFDIETDTGDILGIPTLHTQDTIPTDTEDMIQKELGTHTYEYPHFSSKPVQGKPLFHYALTNTLDTIEIPTHEETIYAITHTDTQTTNPRGLLIHIQEKLSHVPRTQNPTKRLGEDFRQDEVREAWNTILNTNKTFHILSFSVICGSGTYMRSLAMRMGNYQNTGACALSIHRSTIGTYDPVSTSWKTTY